MRGCSRCAVAMVVFWMLDGRGYVAWERGGGEGVPHILSCCFKFWVELEASASSRQGNRIT